VQDEGQVKKAKVPGPVAAVCFLCLFLIPPIVPCVLLLPRNRAATAPTLESNFPPEPGYPPLPTDLHAQLSRFFGTGSSFSDISLRPRLPEV